MKNNNLIVVVLVIIAPPSRRSLSLCPVQGHRFLHGDSDWTIMVCEIPSRCLNKPSNRAIILKQKVTSGVTTGPEINNASNYDPGGGLYLVSCRESPCRRSDFRAASFPHFLFQIKLLILFQESLLCPSLKMLRNGEFILINSITVSHSYKRQW